MIQFNEAQKKAIHHNKGPLLIIAGPGSGKTTVVVNRTINLISEYRIKPDNILVATFTKAAATEMKRRYQKESSPDLYGVTFGTIHSICLKILVTYFGYTYDNILKETEKYRIILNLFRTYNFSAAEEKDSIAKLSSAISYIKNNGGIETIDFDKFEMPEHQIRKVFEGYSDILKENGKLDFDDILLRCRDLLENNPEVLDEIQNIYQYIMIDEFQDTNQIQADIFFMIAHKYKNICVVGDDDQSLYQFRGAKPEIMLHFENVFKEAERVVLNTNYRSDQNIVSAATKFIEKNTNRFEKDLNSYKQKKNPLQLYSFLSELEQAQKTCELIENFHKKNIDYNDMAIIYRTNKESKSVMDLFIKKEIPFRAKKEDIVDVYTHYIFNDLVNFHKLANGSNDYKRWQRALKRPSCYIPNCAWKECKNVNELNFWGIKNGKRYIQVNIEKFKRRLKRLVNLSFEEQIHYILYDIGYLNGLESYCEYMKEDFKTAMDILNELVTESKAFSSFDAWIDHAKQYSAMIKRTTILNEDVDAVSLTTMHGCKGLEYEVVFLIDANEGLTPYEKAITDSELEEERRMFYVGMTRAKSHLIISTTESYHGKKQRKSQYYQELLTSKAAEIETY